jgi:hypothetical protein
MERPRTPMMAFSSAMVTCLARSTACTTCCWCYKWRSETEYNYLFSTQSEQLFLTCPLTSITCKTAFGVLQISK